MPNTLISRPQVKNSILSFIRNLVSKSVFKSIDTLLSPCCDLSIDSISFECTGTDLATITVVLNNPISFPIAGFINLSGLDNVKFSKTITYTGEKTLTFTNFKIDSGQTDITYSLFLAFPSGTGILQGIYYQARIVTDVPTCS